MSSPTPETALSRRRDRPSPAECGRGAWHRDRRRRNAGGGPGARPPVRGASETGPRAIALVLVDDLGRAGRAPTWGETSPLPAVQKETAQRAPHVFALSSRSRLHSTSSTPSTSTPSSSSSSLSSSSLSPSKKENARAGPGRFLSQPRARCRSLDGARVPCVVRASTRHHEDGASTPRDLTRRGRPSSSRPSSWPSSYRPSWRSSFWRPSSCQPSSSPSSCRPSSRPSSW